MDDLNGLLERAERVEALSAALYRKLAQGLPPGSGAKTVFERLAGEEDEHAARIRLLKTKIEARPWNPELRLDLATADALVAEAEMLLCLVEEGPRMSLQEAGRFLVESEHRLAKAHAHSLVAGDPELESFFGDLAQQDQMHIEALRRLAPK